MIARMKMHSKYVRSCVSSRLITQIITINYYYSAINLICVWINYIVMDCRQVLRNRGQGLGILVSKAPKETNASYTLQEPSEASTY